MSDFGGISQGVRIYTINDDFSGKALANPTIPKNIQTQQKENVTLGKHVMVGSGSVILPGVTIGEGSCVGALSLVMDSLDEWGIYFGNPVKRIKKRSKNFFHKKNYIFKKKIIS